MPFSNDIYEGGGYIFQMFLKEKYKIKIYSSRITEDILKALSNLTDLNFIIYY